MSSEQRRPSLAEIKRKRAAHLLAPPTWFSEKTKQRLADAAKQLLVEADALDAQRDAGSPSSRQRAAGS